MRYRPSFRLSVSALWISFLYGKFRLSELCGLPPLVAFRATKIINEILRIMNQPLIKSGYYPFELPLHREAGEKWKPYPIFHGSTAALKDLSCHVSTLVHGFSPHPPHEHEQEEILFVLSGEVDIILKDHTAPDQSCFYREHLQKNQFAYYPANFAHSLETTSQEPAHYLMFRWCGDSFSKNNILNFRFFDFLPPRDEADNNKGVAMQLIFEKQTEYLEMLHCHTTHLAPGAGYAPHADSYDVAILLLEGEVQTLGQNIKAPGVIFYAAGEPHGIFNPADCAARYIVFEFHGHSFKRNSMQTKQIRFTHDAIEYKWDDVPEEKYHNWLQNTKDVLNTRDYTAGGFPFMLQVEPTSICNLSCPLCPAGRHELNRPYRHMRFNEFKSLIDDMERYLLFLVLWNWGEPLMNSELPSMIRYASERGIQTVTSTNGHFLNNEAYTEELLKSGLTTLIVAVDSISPDKYEIYRRRGNVDYVLLGLNKAVLVKKRLGSKTLINVRMVIMKQNEHEIDSIENMARVSGADIFSIKSLNPSCGMVAQDKELLPENSHYRRYEYVANTYERVRTDAICKRVWTMSNILSNGDVVPCCYDYDSEMKVGNILQTPFTQIWNDSAYRRLRKNIYHEMRTIAKCSHCGINYKLSERGWFMKAIDLSSDNKQISFSIIMPTYNRKYCIKNAIDSLLRQTYNNFELIIIDDGSTDETDEYLKETYQGEINNEKIKYFKLPENKGGAFARNFGIQKAKNKWIGYLDTDNQQHSDFLETFAKSIENSANEIHYAQIKCSKTQAIVGHEFNFEELVRFNFIDLGVFVHSSKIYNELGGFDIELLRLIDWDLIIKYTEKYPPKFIEKILLDYDDSEDSSRITNKVSVGESYKQVILNYYKRIPAQIFIEKYTAQNTNLNHAMTVYDKQITRLKQEVTESESKIVDLDQKVQTLTEQVENMGAIVADRDGQIDVLYHSNSWKITEPLRIVGNQLKRFRRGAKLVMPAIKHGGGLRSTLGKAIQLYRREGLAGINRGFRVIAKSSQTTQTQGSGGCDRNDYTEWIRRYDTLSDSDLGKIRSIINGFQKKPLISIIMPVYNPQPEWLIEAIESVCNQLYQQWELCIADDASADKRIRLILESYAAKDKRIKVEFREKNGHISSASNSALAQTTGEWVALLDHDDLLAEHALFWVANTINQHPDADLIYSDEDKIDNSGRRFDPYFKCDWNEDLFYSHNMITHLGIYRTELLRETDGFKECMEGAQDYDLALRYIERIEPKQIHHIPRVLYHWRAHSKSTAKTGNVKPHALLARKMALNEHFQRQEINATAELLNEGIYRIHYALSNPLPLVSLIILTRNRLKLLQKCIESIFKKTTYPNYEILIIDNGSDDPATLRYLKKLQLNSNIHVERDDRPFSFSALNNAAVKLVRGEIICLLNNDIEVISPGWLSEMVSHAVRPGIGTVGARLWYTNGGLQHGGVILGLGPSGVAGHAQHHMFEHHFGYFGRANMIQSLSAVTAACLVIRKSIYEEVGRLNERDLQIAYNDIDFCLRVCKQGYRNIWTPYAELYHHESATRGQDYSPKNRERYAREIQYMKRHWGDILLNDPAYNPNLALDYEDFSLAWPPRIEKL